MGLIQKILRGLQRDRDLPFMARVLKGVQFASAVGLAPYRLRAVTRRGRRSRTIGMPLIANRGRLEIGDDLIMNSGYAPCDLSTLAGGTLQIGHRVIINFGTIISAASAVTLGDDSSVGPYCILIDHEPMAGLPPAPIELGPGAWLAAHVTVLPGTVIGAGSVITAGSIVSGRIPAGVVAGGVPARVLRNISAAESSKEKNVDALAVDSVRWRGVVITDFATGDLAARFRDDSLGHKIGISEIAATDVAAALRTANSAAANFALVWTRPDVALPAFRRVADGVFDMTTAQQLRDDVDRYCDGLASWSNASRPLMVATWTRSPNTSAPMSVQPGSIAWALCVVNERLIDRCSTMSQVTVLDSQRWLEAAGTDPLMGKGWYVGGIPFAMPVFAEAARAVRACLLAHAGQTRTTLVVDVGDEVWRTSAGDAQGAASADFRSALQQLASRGVRVIVLGRNNPTQASSEHASMNFRARSADAEHDVAILMSEFKVEADVVVFVSTDTMAGQRVRAVTPGVLVPRWPADALQFPAALASLDCFQHWRTPANTL